jgi:hypothetical protein
VTTAVSQYRWLISVAAIGVFLSSVAQFYDRQTGFTSLIGFGERFDARTLPAVKAVPRHVDRQSAGYDGQFYAQMATDPLLRDAAIDRAMDDAPLRARRILFSWTAYVAGLGRPSWILQAYALQNVVCWLLLSVLLLRWFPIVNGRMVALWLATLFAGGLLWSVRSSLLDGPSLLLLAVGMAALESGRPWISAAIFGIAGLGRETNVLAAAPQVRPQEMTRTWRSIAAQAAQLAVIVLPLLIWFDYIYSIYRGLLYTTGKTLAAPLSGFLWKWQVTLAAFDTQGWNVSRFGLLTLIAVTVQAAYVIARLDWKNPWWRLGLPYAALMLLLGRPLWEGDPATALRVLLPLSLAFNVLLRECTRADRFWPLLVGGNLTVVPGLVLLQVPFISRWL